MESKISPTIFCYNLSSNYLSANLVLHTRTKHIEIDFRFVHERVANNSSHVRFVPSEDQLADCFTKPLSTQHFLVLLSKITVLEFEKG